MDLSMVPALVTCMHIWSDEDSDHQFKLARYIVMVYVKRCYGQGNTCMMQLTNESSGIIIYNTLSKDNMQNGTKGDC